MSKSILCIDTELSCWDDSVFQRKQIMEIFEFGLAEIDVETLTISRSGHYYIKNTRHEVTPYCTELTSITQSMLDKQGFALEDASRIMKDKWGIGNRQKPIFAWGDERKWMEADFKEKGIEYPFHNSLINLADYYRFGFCESERKRSGLKKAANRYNVEIITPAHTAEADAKTLANVLIEMIKRGDIWPGLAKKP